jgi:hypothetical protein
MTLLYLEKLVLSIRGRKIVILSRKKKRAPGIE